MQASKEDSYPTRQMTSLSQHMMLAQDRFRPQDCAILLYPGLSINVLEKRGSFILHNDKQRLPSHSLSLFLAQPCSHYITCLQQGASRYRTHSGNSFH